MSPMALEIPDDRVAYHQRIAAAIADSVRGELPGLQGAVIQAWADADVPVSVTPFTAGRAGVIEVSRSLQLALDALAHVYLHAAVVIGYARQSQPARKRQAREDEAVARLAAILRHLALRARIAGELPVVTRLTPPLEASADGLYEWSLAFTFARGLELLGGTHPGDLDLTAFTRIRDRLGEGGDAGPTSLIAFSAVHLLERAVLVRPAPRHPPVEERRRALPGGEAPSIDGWFVSALEIACALDERFDASFLRLLAKGEMLALARADVAWAERANARCAGPLDPLLDDVRGVATPAGRAVLGGLADGRVADALAAVADEQTLRQVLDPSRPLTFAALRDVFATRAGELTAGDPAAFALVAARLAAAHLAERPG
jgi:hypothetical protein